jgi:hypothetical protein
MPQSQKRKKDAVDIIQELVNPTKRLTKNSYIRKLEERQLMEDVKKESRKKDLIKQKKIIDKIKKMGEKYIMSDEYLKASIETDNQVNIQLGELEIRGESPSNSPKRKVKEDVNKNNVFKAPMSGFSTISYTVINK